MIGRFIRLAALAGLALLTAACGDPLAKLKKSTKARYASESPELLVAATVERLALTQEGPEVDSTTLTIGSLELTLPAPVKTDEKPNGRSIRLTYPEFTVAVVKIPLKPTLATLPTSWGSTELEKMLHICSASGKMIDDATSKAELEEAVVLLAARGSLAPPGALERVAVVTAPTFKGLMSGTMDKKGPKGCEMVFEPEPRDGMYYKIAFSRTEGESSNETVNGFLAKMKVKIKDP